MKKLFSFFNEHKKNEQSQSTQKIGLPLNKIKLTSNLKDNSDKLKELFSYPTNIDFTIKDLYIKSLNKDAMLFYLNGMVKKEKIEEHIIKPLMWKNISISTKIPLSDIEKKILTTIESNRFNNLKVISEDLLKGHVVVLIDGYKEALSIVATGFEYRNISKAENEVVIKGPHESFAESQEVNRSLIRKQLRNRNLITETLIIGETSSTDISVMYIKDVTEPKLIENIKNRIKEIKVDGIKSVSILEQHIEERPYSLFPSLLYTERPDRAAHFLKEGNIVILSDNTPACLVAPATFWSFFHTAEDTYERWAYGNFLRIIRLFAIFISLLAPASYIAMTNFHEELIPLDLLISIAGSRETVPFPALVEVLIMEVSFELVREAGIRVPSPIGPTVGIVGALILGQAAVDANIVSPIMIIIVGITAISSFAIADTSLNFSIRILRFGITALAATMGFIGISVGLICLFAYMLSIKSFDVPYFSPLAPYTKSPTNTILRAPVWKRWLNPFKSNKKIK